jgi:carbon-monoxide dehydrogenase medium subunit
MKWPAFDYARATTLDGLWSIWEEAGPEARLLAGGQSLLAALAFRLSDPPALIDITRINALGGIADHGEILRIGALTCHAELGRDGLVRRHAPLLTEAIPLIAHAAIRNRGTVGGSLALADPAAELPACMVALGATLVLRARAGERRVAARDFFKGLFETDLAPFELIAAVEVPKAGPTHRSAIVEVTRRSGDYAMAGLALALELDAGTVAAPRLVYFGVGGQPVVAAAAAAALAGRRLDGAAIATAVAALDEDLDPPGDLHGPPELKRHLAKVLTTRALRQIMQPAEAAA